MDTACLGEVVGYPDTQLALLYDGSSLRGVAMKGHKQLAWFMLSAFRAVTGELDYQMANFMDFVSFVDEESGGTVGHVYATIEDGELFVGHAPDAEKYTVWDLKPLWRYNFVGED